MNKKVAGKIALEIWCLYFLPIGVLSFFHFKDDNLRGVTGEQPPLGGVDEKPKALRRRAGLRPPFPS